MVASSSQLGQGLGAGLVISTCGGKSSKKGGPILQLVAYFSFENLMSKIELNITKEAIIQRNTLHLEAV